MTRRENILAPKPGRVLLSEPFLQDKNFTRSVVLIMEHKEEEGTFGLVLNQPTDAFLGQFVDVPELPEITIFEGGPVELNTLHFIHRIEELAEGSVQIGPDIFWGDDFQGTLEFLVEHPSRVNDARFFLGYSGWAPGQLMEERMDKAWWISEATHEDVFSEFTGNDLWQHFIKKLGPDFGIASGSPLDPQWN